MAAKVATLSINIVSKHAKAVKGMKAVSVQGKRTQSSFMTMAKGIAAAGVAMIAFNTAMRIGRSLASSLFGAFEKIDQIGKFAKQTGFTIEQIVGLGHGADQTGSSMETLQKAMMKQNKVLGEAGAGYLANRKLVEGLGLDYERLSQMRPGDAFMEIADAIRKSGDETRKSAIATQLWGRSGAQLINLANAGRGAMAAYTQEMRDSGQIFDTETHEQVAGYIDAVDRVKKVWQGFFIENSGRIAESLERLLAIIELVLEKMGDVIDRWERIPEPMRWAMSGPGVRLPETERQKKRRLEGEEPQKKGPADPRGKPGINGEAGVPQEQDKQMLAYQKQQAEEARKQTELQQESTAYQKLMSEHLDEMSGREPGDTIIVTEAAL